MQNTLLLADDDLELSGLLKEYFASEGFDVRVAHDGVEALAELRKSGLDLVVATTRLDEDIDLNELLTDLVDVVNYEVP